MGEYTYRNIFAAETPESNERRLRPVTLQAVRPVSLIDTSVIKTFEELISREDVSEREIQLFLSQNRELLQALGYVDAYPHISLHEEGSPELIPDFLLEIPGSTRLNILDLKLPSARLTARSPYLRASSQLIRALAQLRKYEGFFDKLENRRAFEREFGMSAFKPELIVVMGRSHEFGSLDERVEIEKQVGRIKVVTYDDLIHYGNTRSIYIP